MSSISVIIPVYKVEALLPRCVDSLLSQTFPDFELFLTDDGSPDKSGVLCDEAALGDARITVIHKPNGGVAAARNAGLDLCTGEYVTFVDSDDWVLSSFLREMMYGSEDLIVQTVAPEDENGHPRKGIELKNETILKPTAEDVQRLLLDGSLNLMVCKRYKREITERYSLRLCPEVDFGEDTLFTVSYAVHASSIAVRNVANYRYVVYTQRETLSNHYSLERLSVIRLSNRKIAETLFPTDAESAQRTYLQRNVIPYEMYTQLLLERKPKALGSRIRAWLSLQRNAEFQKILPSVRYLPERYAKALRSQSGLMLLGCVLGYEIVHLKNDLKGKKKA